MTDLKIETNTGPFVPGWVLYAAHAVAAVFSVWLATEWMLSGLQATLIGLTVIAGGYNFMRPTPVLSFGVLSVAVIFLLTPVGAAVTWRSYLLVALVPLVLRLAGACDMVALRTSVSWAALGVLLRGYLLLAAPAQLILIILAIMGTPEKFGVAWFYPVAAVLVILTIVAALSLAASNRRGLRVI